MLLKLGVSNLFESGPIRTQVSLRMERTCKETNKQLLNAAIDSRSRRVSRCSSVIAMYHLLKHPKTSLC